MKLRRQVRDEVQLRHEKMAVVGTQIIATLIAVYGLFMTPLGWGWALFVWAYAVTWFLLNDRLKLLAYRILDPVTAGG